MSSNLLKKGDSSDYITYKKRQVIAAEYVKADTLNEFNPVKLNSNKYNQNFKFVPTIITPTTTNSNCLIHSKNYELKQDYTWGVNYIKVVCDQNSI